MKTFLPQKILKTISCFLFLLLTAFGYSQTETFTTTGNFIVPNGITTISVQAWGAGGGSGGHGTSSVTNGGDGGNTTFSSITAGGGFGSFGSTIATPTGGGNGGSATDGTINTNGSDGGVGTQVNNSATGGAGGASPNGGLSVAGAIASGNNSSAIGTNGTIPGGGAGGSCRSASNGNPENRRSTGGGGGGAYSQGTFSSLTPGNSITATIGVGGTAGTGNQGNGGVGGRGQVVVTWDCTNALTSGAGTNNQSVCLNSAITTITYDIKGGRNQPTVTGLPPGVVATFNATTGVLTISGTPTIAGVFNYTVTQTGACAYTATGALIIASTTWNGTAWTNGVPDATKSVIFSGNYASADDITACGIHVTNNATVSILSGADVTLSGTIVVDSGSNFTLQSNVNLFQPAGITNSSAISIKRASSNEVKRLDYNLWSSPVVGQNLLAFSPLTVATRFYVYNSGTNQYNAVTPSTTSFAAATGYLIRMPNNASDVTPASWEGTFTGVPNNGDYSRNGLTSGSYVAIGNPYPSTMSLSAFLAANSTDGTVYFWRKTNNAANSSYATFTTAGGVANTGGSSAIVPNGILQVGQGFIVKANATSLTFTNAMRVSNDVNQFLRTNATNSVTSEDKSRIWLNINSNVGVAGQLLVGYMTGATNGVDNGIDGRFINDSQNAFTSLINGEEFVIQGRSLPFSAADVVPLGFRTTQAGLYTISIDQVDGLFNDATQPIYIKDNITSAEHNLKVSPYEFTSAVGVFNSRFEIIYQTTLSVVQPVSATNVLVYKQDQELKIKVTETDLMNVTVYDLSGRIIATRDAFNANEASLSLGMLSNQVVLVKVVTTSGELTQKVLW